MRVMIASEAGRPEVRNDDWAGATAAGIAVVLDGLTEAGATGCAHGTGWYVHQLGVRLLGLADDRSLTLADALGEAIDQVGGLHRDGCDLSHPGSPAATVAAVRPRGDSVDYLVLSDAVVVLDNGHEPLVATDLRVREHLQDMPIPAAGEGVTDAFAAFIQTQQGIRNQPGGYWVAQHDPEAAQHAVTGTAPGVAGAAVLSDGAALLATDFAAMTWRELMDIAYLRGPGDIIAATRELERRDADRTVWPRYKTHDDATMVVVAPP